MSTRLRQGRGDGHTVFEAGPPAPNCPQKRPTKGQFGRTGSALRFVKQIVAAGRVMPISPSVFPFELETAREPRTAFFARQLPSEGCVPDVE